MSNLTVYNQMISSPTDLFTVLKQEIGVKSKCLPFAIKAISALGTLGNKLTESQSIKAAHTFLDNLQTLTQGGITPEDYDKLDFIKRGDVITISARVEAFLRAAARKGYRITETLVAVPKEDGDTTYFKENFYNGEIVYTLEDKRIQGDRQITSTRLVSGYFTKFICRLEVTNIQQNKRVVMTTCEMSNEEILSAAKASDNGIFKTKWEEYINSSGRQSKRKVATAELNEGSIWNTWTSEMVAKTVIRRALKRIREVLPELKETIYAFENEPVVQDIPVESFEIEVPIEISDVDLDSLSERQLAEVKEMQELFMVNPKLAEDTANEIIKMFDGSNLQEVINTYYASLPNLKRSKRLRPILAPIFELLTGSFEAASVEINEKSQKKEESKEKTEPENDNESEEKLETDVANAVDVPSVAPDNNDDALFCSVCCEEIKSEKSKQYYASHPNVIVTCYNCRDKR